MSDPSGAPPPSPPPHSALPVESALAPTISLPGLPLPHLAAPGLPLPRPGRGRRARPRERVPAWLAIVRQDVARSRWALFLACTWAFAVVTALTALSWLPPQVVTRLALEAVVPDAPEPILRAFALAGLLPLAWLLARRGVLRESRDGAWEALARLPVRPGVLLLAKAAHGSFLLLFLASCGALLVVSGSPFGERFDEARSLAAFGAVGAFALTSYALLFFAAVWGRHRLLVLGALAGLAVLTGLGPRTPGLELVTETLGPGLGPRAARALACAAGLLVGTVLLASARRLTLLRLASGPLRAADVVRAGWIGLACLGLAALRRPPPAAVRLDPPVLSPQLPVELEVGGFRAEERAAAEELAAAVGADLHALAALGFRLPPLAIEAARDCEPTVFRRATLRGARGVVVLAAYTRPELDRDELRRWLIDELVAEATGARWERGWARVLRDGLARWRVGLGPHDRARAAYALSSPPPRAADRPGGGPPEGLLYLSRRVSAAALPPSDVLDRAIAGWFLSRLEAATVEAWVRGAVPSVERPLPPEVQRAGDLPLEAEGRPLPRLTAWQVAPTAEGALRVELTPGITTLLGAWAVVHGDDEDDLARDERLDGVPTLTTLRAYPRGARVRVTLVLRVDALACEVPIETREVRVR